MIEVKDLSFAYNEKDVAIHNVSFTIKDHEWLSIIGHNGSGKSTIAKLLVGLLQANSGTIKNTTATTSNINQMIVPTVNCGMPV